ncbi:DUF2169 domain-containing protein [Thalassococcus sp. S3]|uniref:DUF2169 family type VI secretion system accessory protein n=1 Tax=Thalassococcus sp. S3 TaxID=2017482 RepID=UPI00102426DF|nr:DUF2169 domain-containing protein [Thalassococcus sp. S3]QBF33643.1 hypothetical protein CFI11_20845 [Thalassococcus sp. S3]
MRLINNTVFQTMTFDHWMPDDTEAAVVIVKAVLYREGDAWAYRPGQVEFQISDLFDDGDPADTPLLAEQDIAPGKAATDLLIRATAYAPGDTPLTDWPVSVEIPDRLRYGFHVRGPSIWTRRSTQSAWSLSSPEPVEHVPIRYDLAYGGHVVCDDGSIDVFEQNPAGLGYAGTGTLEHLELLAPQIGLLPELLSAKPGTEMSVHGFGPIAKAWLPRRAYAGTLDEIWQATRHPRMPKDYDLRFWNAAPGPLQIEPFLKGGVPLIFGNLRPDAPEYRITLPDISIIGQSAGREIAFDLDTICIDIEPIETRHHMLTLLWRTTIKDAAEMEIEMTSAKTDA